MRQFRWGKGYCRVRNSLAGVGVFLLVTNLPVAARTVPEPTFAQSAPIQPIATLDITADRLIPDRRDRLGWLALLSLLGFLGLVLQDEDPS
jgi:hypothetical protein